MKAIQINHLIPDTQEYTWTKLTAKYIVCPKCQQMTDLRRHAQDKGKSTYLRSVDKDRLTQI